MKTFGIDEFHCAPLVYSSNLYAVHFDNAPIGYLDLDSKKTIL